MAKHPACEAAISSSGFVPFPCSKRVPKEYCVFESTPLSVVISPLPSFRPPRHSADALRFIDGNSSSSKVYTKLMTRRELLTFAAGAGLLRAANAPAPPVAVARCASYDEDLSSTLSKMFDQIGGAAKIVSNKTVTIKLNLTGSPGLRFQGHPLGVTHYSHPKTIGAMLNVLGRAGAKRIRLV